MNELSRKSPRKTNDSTLARLRIARGLTQAQLAEMIGCRFVDISRWEHGTHAPSAAYLVKLATALDCSVDDILQTKPAGD